MPKRPHWSPEVHVNTPTPKMSKTNKLTHTEKEKYDRQIRLWGESGQNSLKSSSVLILGDGIVGMEAGKGLILAGISDITVIGFEEESNSQTKTNFFNRIEDLQELNPNCTIKYIKKRSFLDFENDTDSTSDLFKYAYNVIIIADKNFSKQFLKKLKEIIPNRPILISLNFGQIGYIRTILDKKGFYVENAHHEHALPDMRLDLPRKEFIDYCDSFSICESEVKNKNVNEEDDRIDRIPFPVLLYKFWLQIDPLFKLDNPKLIKDTIKQRLETLEKNVSEDYQPENIEQAIINLNKFVQTSKGSHQNTI